MKFNLIAFIVLLGSVSQALHAWGYKHTLVNCTGEPISVHLYYSACNGDDFTLARGGQKTITDHLCILEAADVTHAGKTSYVIISGGGSSGIFKITVKHSENTIMITKSENPQC